MSGLDTPRCPYGTTTGIEELHRQHINVAA
jgi:hypothetical protein